MLIALLMIAWPVAELLVAIKVAGVIGVLATVLLLIAGWPLGLWAMRTQGRVAWRRLQAAVAAGRTPAREVLDAALVLMAGALLIVPGFITDAIALLLLAPPTRALARAAIRRNVRGRFVTRVTGASRRGSAYDVDSTARDIDPPPLPR
jgi:UPF0716 protein FxsA